MDEIIALATQKIIAMGYSAQYEDLVYYANEATENIKNRLGTNEVPVALNYLLINMVAGLYLQDILLEANSNGSVSSLKEGDISITYENGKSIWDTLNEMTQISEGQLASFRRIAW